MVLLKKALKHYSKRLRKTKPLKNSIYRNLIFVCVHLTKLSYLTIKIINRNNRIATEGAVYIAKGLMTNVALRIIKVCLA